MFSLLSASHSISSHLAPENCKDLAFFLVNGFLKATPWFSSTVSADLMGYYSCSRTGNKNREGFESICVRRKKKKTETCLKQKWEKEENEKYESMFTFVFFQVTVKCADFDEKLSWQAYLFHLLSKQQLLGEDISSSSGLFSLCF